MCVRVGFPFFYFVVRFFGNVNIISKVEKERLGELQDDFGRMIGDAAENLVEKAEILTLRESRI